jgi:hypothetical protein
MIKKKFLWGTCLILSSIASIQIANAKSWYPASAPASYHIGGTLAGTNMISCSTCHSSSPQTENNVTTSFGIAFGNFDDNVAFAYSTLAPLDSDGDGFSNQQEAFSGSQLNYKTSTPLLTGAVTSGNISVKPYVGTITANDVSLTPLTGFNILGGMVSFTAQNNAAFPAQATATFMFKDGGAQTGATIQFYKNDGTLNTSISTLDSSFIANVNNGSVDVGIKDEGVFDLYSTATFINTAITRRPAFIPVASPELINPYAQVDPYAVISPTATIDNYAVIDAYAIVDNNTTIGAYAQIGSYAYIAPNVDIYTGIDTYTNVTVDKYAEVTATVAAAPTTVAVRSGLGYVASKFSVTTTPPTLSLFGSAATGDDDGNDSNSAGGLHCMTTGLGLQGLLFLGLFGTGYLLRRKKK